MPAQAGDPIECAGVMAPHALEPGSLLAARYQIEAVLGHGGMGVVYRARDQQTGQPVAVKFFFAPHGVEEGLRRFQREFRALSRLQHPRIVQVFDYGEAGGLPFYVMEFVGGGDLAGLRGARGGRLSVREATEIGMQLCDALAYIHAQGVIHRDLKPSNVMLQAPSTPAFPPSTFHFPLSIKLVDFGLAKLADVSINLTQSGVMLGTVNYMSPEQVQGLPIDPRSDLYSLGVLLFELTTGQAPFAADTPIAVMLQHISQSPPFLRSLDASISPEFQDLVLSLLAKRASDRPPSAEAVLGALSGLTGLAAPAPVEMAAAPRADAVFRAGLIGRRDELARLDQCLERAWAGEGQLAVIEGEAGVGKTRLAMELGGQVRLRGGLRLAGACHETERVPYGPIAEWFNDMFRASDDFGSIIAGLETELARLVPRLVPPELAAPGDVLDPQQAKLRFFDAVMRALGRLSERKPLMLLLDDVQWADEATLELLHYIVRNARGPRIISGQVRAAASPPAELLDPVRLRQLLVEHFSEGELRDLCFDLRIDYELLPGVGKGDRARELVAFCERRERLTELASACQQLRPGAAWRQAPAEDERRLILPHASPEHAQRIFVCATARSEERDASPRLAELLRDLNRLGLLERISLERLSPESTADLIAAMLGLDQAPAELAARIYAESEGNPFFVEEILKALAEEGLLARHEGRWRLQADLGLTMLRIPSTIADVIERRLARLAEAERGALNWAAVLGHEFAYEVLYPASGAEEDALLDALDSLLRDQLIAEVRDPRQDRYRFTHAKIREVVYNALMGARRKKMHRAAGEVIERVYAARLGEMAPALAHHFAQGGDVPKALRYNVLAGDRARQVYANQEAIAFYTQAIELAQGEPQPFEVEHLIAAQQGLGEVYYLIGEYEQAAVCFRAVIDLAPQAGWDERERARALAEAWRSLGQTCDVRGDYEQALHCYDQGLSNLGVSNLPEWARLLNEMAWVYIHQGNYLQAREHCEQAVRMASDTPSVVATAYGHLGDVAQYQGDYEQAIAYHQKSLELWQQAGDKSQVARSLNNLGTLAEEQDAYDEAVVHYQKSLAICQEIGHSLGTAFLLNNLGVLYQDHGQLELAREHFEQSLDTFRRIGHKEGAGIACSNLADVHIALHEIDEAQVCLAQAQAIAQELGDRSGMAYTWILMAEIELSKNYLERAQECALRALQMANESGIKLYAGRAHQALGRVYLGLGQAAQARRHLAEACAIYEACGKRVRLEQTRDLFQHLRNEP